MKNYRIERECWNEKTYNGYTDNPYWRVQLNDGQVIGLKDDGSWHGIRTWSNNAVIIACLSEIVTQCHLNIKTIEAKE
jgi:hypothetical protein